VSEVRRVHVEVVKCESGGRRSEDDTVMEPLESSFGRPISVERFRRIAQAAGAAPRCPPSAPRHCASWRRRATPYAVATASRLWRRATPR
jgi:hypothetical protein